MQPPKAPNPARIAPHLVTLTTRPPEGEWRYEIKYDGYRLLARIDGDQVQLFTKNGHDWTDRMPLLAKDLRRLAVHSAWLDGEVVIQEDDGRPAFQALQSAFATRATDDLVYVAFDLMYLNGADLGVWGAMEPKTNVSPTNAFRCLLPRRPSRQNSCACRPPG